MLPVCSVASPGLSQSARILAAMAPPPPPSYVTRALGEIEYPHSIHDKFSDVPSDMFEVTVWSHFAEVYLGRDRYTIPRLKWIIDMFRRSAEAATKRSIIANFHVDAIRSYALADSDGGNLPSKTAAQTDPLQATEQGSDEGDDLDTIAHQFESLPPIPKGRSHSLESVNASDPGETDVGRHAPAGVGTTQELGTPHVGPVSQPDEGDTLGGAEADETGDPEAGAITAPLVVIPRQEIRKAQTGVTPVTRSKRTADEGHIAMVATTDNRRKRRRTDNRPSSDRVAQLSGDEPESDSTDGSADNAKLLTPTRTQLPANHDVADEQTWVTLWTNYATTHVSQKPLRKGRTSQQQVTTPKPHTFYPVARWLAMEVFGPVGMEQFARHLARARTVGPAAVDISSSIAKEGATAPHPRPVTPTTAAVVAPNKDFDILDPRSSAQTKSLLQSNLDALENAFLAAKTSRLNASASLRDHFAYLAQCHLHFMFMSEQAPRLGSAVSKMLVKAAKKRTGKASNDKGGKEGGGDDDEGNLDSDVGSDVSEGNDITDKKGTKKVTSKGRGYASLLWDWILLQRFDPSELVTKEAREIAKRSIREELHIGYRVHTLQRLFGEGILLFLPDNTAAAIRRGRDGDFEALCRILKMGLPDLAVCCDVALSAVRTASNPEAVSTIVPYRPDESGVLRHVRQIGQTGTLLSSKVAAPEADELTESESADVLLSASVPPASGTGTTGGTPPPRLRRPRSSVRGRRTKATQSSRSTTATPIPTPDTEPPAEREEIATTSHRRRSSHDPSPDQWVLKYPPSPSGRDRPLVS